VNIICNALLMITISFIVLKEYTILQSYHYEFSKYLYHLQKERKKYWYFLYCLLTIFLFKFNLIYLCLVTILLFYLIKESKPKYTNRIKRVLIINGILLTILLLTNTLKYVFTLPFLYLCILQCISLFVEKIVFSRYLKKAKRKIKNKYVIGITGSCGKTSVKNIIYDLMVNDFNVSKSPKSYNTRIGIVKSINENVSSYDEYFVCEYGVDKLKGMDKLLRIVKPNVAIITEIGNQHLLSFKNVNNILKEKIKLIESLDNKGIGIINNDNEYLRNYDYKSKTILRYGIEFYSDVMGKNIYLDSQYSEFDLYIKNRYISRVRISLLSRHSVENVLCGITVCLALNMDIKDILRNLKNLSFLEHRLERKKIQGIEVIDDSFNSNIKGFKEALEILSKDNKYKVVITPGIIEQGNNNENVSIEIAKELINKADYVCLVTKNSEYIQKYFMENNYSNYVYKDNFLEAFDHVKKIDKEKIILIENDLPDIYLK